MMHPYADTLLCTVGHLRPVFNSWTGFRHLAFIPQSPDDLYLPSYNDLDLIHNNLSSEYYFLFGLRRLLVREGNIPRRVLIAHYRRFLAVRPIGVPAASPSFARVIHPDAVEREAPLSCLLPTGDWLIGSPVKFVGGMLHQFRCAHPLQDLLRFFSASIDRGILTPDQVGDMLRIDLMIPASSVGIVPGQVFLDIMLVLERAALAFFNDGYIPREAYQSRIIGFCLERLHSYLLICEAQKHGVFHLDYCGHQIVVSEGDCVLPTT